MSKGPRHRRGLSYFPVCTGSAVDAVRPQLLLRRQFCAAVCRGRWRAQPSATKERYGCGHPLRVHIGPLVRIHRTASFAVTPQPLLRRPTFSALPEKVGKKMRLETRHIARSRARFLAASRPERPLRAQDCNRSDSFRFRQMYYTYLRADCINFGSAHFRNTRPITILHHRRMRRWPAISRSVCFSIFLRGNCHRWERCLHAGGAVV